ncbi:MAG: sulfatase [Planctomycetota bacterium]|nr:MAG: sulfatase [Planctomycetota bacterium]
MRSIHLFKLFLAGMIFVLLMAVGASGQLNVLMVTVDDMNYNSAGVTGCTVPDITPNIDQLASEGMRFVHAHVTIAVCQPARSVWMTGRYPHRNGAEGFEPIDPAVPTLQEQLNAAGYYNGILGKTGHLKPYDKFCWDVMVEGGDLGSGRDPALYYQHTKSFIEAAQAAGNPFFLMANSHDPHRPFATRTYDLNDVEVPCHLPDLPDIREELGQYYTSLHRGDETVGEVLRALADTGEENNTLVMFMSDNGMAFPFAKTNVWLASTRTPWIVRWPGVVQAGTVDSEHMISGIDFMPTILEALGLPQVEGMDGQSFVPVLTGGTQSERDRVYTVFHRTAAGREYPMRSIQGKWYGYIFNAWSDGQTVFINESQNGLTWPAMVAEAQTDPEIAARVQFFEYRVVEELYDYEVDPCALNNLVDDPQHEQLLQQYRAEMLDKMESVNDPLADTFAEYIALPGDFDFDLDADQEDFGLFQACLSGIGVPHEVGCKRADLDDDSDVDEYDFNIFYSCMGGPNVPIDPDCVN